MERIELKLYLNNLFQGTKLSHGAINLVAKAFKINIKTVQELGWVGPEKQTLYSQNIPLRY